MDPEETTQDIAPHQQQEAEHAEVLADDSESPPHGPVDQPLDDAAVGDDDASTLRTQLSDVLGRYRALLLARDPDVPEELVHGDTVAELESSYERAAALVDRLRRRAAEQTAQDRVPAGAPARRGPETSALSSQKKIMLGLQRPN
jgi:hypothetical protein